MVSVKAGPPTETFQSSILQVLEDGGGEMDWTERRAIYGGNQHKGKVPARKFSLDLGTPSISARGKKQ